MREPEQRKPNCNNLVSAPVGCATIDENDAACKQRNSIINEVVRRICPPYQLAANLARDIPPHHASKRKLKHLHIIPTVEELESSCNRGYANPTNTQAPRGTSLSASLHKDTSTTTAWRVGYRNKAFCMMRTTQWRQSPQKKAQNSTRPSR